jgi:hypothetical protein
MRFALRGRGTRHDDLRPRSTWHREPMHLTLRTQPRPFG